MPAMTAASGSKGGERGASPRGDPPCAPAPQRPDRPRREDRPMTEAQPDPPSARGTADQLRGLAAHLFGDPQPAPEPESAEDEAARRLKGNHVPRGGRQTAPPAAVGGVGRRRLRPRPVRPVQPPRDRPRRRPAAHPAGAGRHRRRRRSGHLRAGRRLPHSPRLDHPRILPQALRQGRRGPRRRRRGRRRHRPQRHAGHPQARRQGARAVGLGADRRAAHPGHPAGVEDARHRRPAARCRQALLAAGDRRRAVRRLRR